jgi:DNA-binding beta-propeller fold protein YncE
VLGAGALAVLAAAAVAGTLLLDDGKSGPGRRAAVPRPPPVHPAVGLTIANVGWRPRGVAVAAGSVWIISAKRPRMTRLDARTGRRSGVQSRIGLEPWNVAADGDAVWVAIPRQAAVVGVDARTGRVVRRVRVPIDPVMLAAGPSGLWVVGRGRGRQPDAVLRYDRGGRRLLARLEIPQKVHAIAVGGGAAWVALAVDARILRVSPAGKVTASASTTGPASALAYGSGSVCAAVPADDAVACSRTATLNFVTTKLAARPAQLTIAGGRAWVASHTDHTVVVVDPKDVRRVGRPLAVPLNPFAVAAGAGHVWVTGIGRNTVTRIDP